MEETKNRNKAGRLKEPQTEPQKAGWQGIPKAEPTGGISMPHDRGYKKSLSRPAEFLHFLKKYVRAD